MLGRAQERSQQDALVSCPLNRINSVIIMCSVSLSNDSKVSMVLFATRQAPMNSSVKHYISRLLTTGLRETLLLFCLVGASFPTKRDGRIAWILLQMLIHQPDPLPVLR